MGVIGSLAELASMIDQAEPPTAELQVHDGWRAIVRRRADGKIEIDIEDGAEPWFDLVSVTEIAQRLDRSVGAIHQLRRRNAAFPAPLVTLATGPVWAWSDVERWAAVPRPSGRPRKER